MALITNCLFIDLIILLLLLFITIYLYVTRNFEYWKKHGVLEMRPKPFVGNFGMCLMAKKSVGQWIHDMYEWGKNAQYVGFYLFDKPGLLIRDPDMVKQILTSDFNYFQDRFAKASPHDKIGNANLFLVKNPAWKLIRNKFNPLYTSLKLKNMFGLMLEIGDDLMTHMNNLKLNETGKTIELKELCAKFTTDMIATTAFGVRANSLNNPNAEFRNIGRKMFEASLPRNLALTAIFFIPQLVKPLGLKFITDECQKLIRNAIWSVINEREQSGSQRHDLIDLLVELRSDKNNKLNDTFDFDGDNLVAQAAVFFIGGFETSSTTMSFTLYELAVNSEIQAKVRTEIFDAIKKYNGQVTYNMVTNLSYLDMCISETLRKYPALPFLDRVTTEKYEITNSNLVLEKGTPVVISISGIQWNPEYFPDPSKYDPERFTEENKKMRHSFSYLPFGEGLHMCIGMRLGLLQVKLGLIKLLTEYEFSPCKETPIPLRITPKSVIMTAEGGIYLNVRKIFT